MIELKCQHCGKQTHPAYAIVPNLTCWNCGELMSIPTPKECTPVGEYECQVPMAINGRVQGIDYCIADIIAALNAANITTVASCCGHGKMEGVISLEDGRELIVMNVKKGE